MTDRELLELAAKAAGMTVFPEGSPWPDGDGWFFCVQHGDPGMHFRPCDNRAHRVGPWLPLADDGDALRLAVKLGISLDFCSAMVLASYSVGGDEFDFVDEKYGTDSAAATRRAIVRAAAELGKSMQPTT